MGPFEKHGVPRGWRGESWGWRPRWEFAVVEDESVRALLLESHDDRSTISKDLRGRVDFQATPILAWRWKVTTLPLGGDARKKATTDQAAQVYGSICRPELNVCGTRGGINRENRGTIGWGQGNDRRTVQGAIGSWPVAKVKHAGPMLWAADFVLI